MPCKPVPYDKTDLIVSLLECLHTRPMYPCTCPSLPPGAFQASKLVTAGDVIARPCACFLPPSPLPPPPTTLTNLEPGYVVPVSRW